MKKLFYLSSMLFLVLVFMFSFTSCQKDGVYTPKKKISEIYYKYSSGNKTLEERWHWNGNLLEKVQYFWGGENSTVFYKYEKKRLIEITNGTESYKFIYDRSKLSKVEMREDSELIGEIKVTHTKNKITKLEFAYYIEDYYYAKGGNNNNMIHSLRVIIPETTCKNLIERNAKIAQTGTKGTYTFTITYTYEGNNIKEEKYLEDNEEVVYRYKYDKEKNPFFNLLYGGHSYTDYEFSQNNPVYASYTRSNGTISETEFIYTYEKGYPIEVTYRYITDSYIGGTYYYEYVK